MSTVECHACLRTIDASEALWWRPFVGGERHGEVITTYADVTDHPVPGAKPYCPACLAEKVRQSSEPENRN